MNGSYGTVSLYTIAVCNLQSKLVFEYSVLGIFCTSFLFVELDTCCLRDW